MKLVIYIISIGSHLLAKDITEEEKQEVVE